MVTEKGRNQMSLTILTDGRRRVTAGIWLVYGYFYQILEESPKNVMLIIAY